MTFVPPPVRADLLTAPRRRNAQPEHAIQTTFIQWVDLMCASQYPELALGYAIPNARQSKLDAYKRHREGARSGPADWCLPLPHSPLPGFPAHTALPWMGLMLEFKVTGGTTQKTQRAWLAGVAEAGYSVVQPTSTQQAIDAVLQYLALPARYDVAKVRAHGESLLLERAKLRLKRRKAK